MHPDKPGFAAGAEFERHRVALNCSGMPRRQYFAEVAWTIRADAEIETSDPMSQSGRRIAVNTKIKPDVARMVVPPRMAEAVWLAVMCLALQRHEKTIPAPMMAKTMRTQIGKSTAIMLRPFCR